MDESKAPETPGIPSYDTNPILKLRKLLAESVEKGSEKSGEGWNRSWEKGITPWDTGSGEPQPPLREVFEIYEETLKIPRHGYALVPGCGRGYDAKYLAELGFETWGVDIAPIAVEKAKEWVATLASPPSNLEFKVMDFFDFEPPQERFTLIYDYTFFCAIPPSIRAAWGEQMTKLTKPGGFLVTLCFPMDGDRKTGPPFSLSPETYKGVLSSDDWDVVLDVEPQIYGEFHEGRERLIVRKRKET